MRQLRLYILLGLTFIIYSYAHSQTGKSGTSSYPEIGKRCPEFVFKEVTNANSTTLSLKALQGQYVILDFWTRWCTACVASFPRTNTLQAEFDKKVKIILVGLDDEYIRPLFEKTKTHYKLQLPSAFDKSIFKNFGIQTVPHLIWIDPNGIVRAITDGESMSKINIENFISGSPLDLPEKSNSKRLADDASSYDASKPFKIYDNGGADTAFIFRSLLSKWDKKIPVIWEDHFTTYYQRPKEVFVSGASLSWLYRMAYSDTIPNVPLFGKEATNYGKFWVRPILELSDTSKFQSRYDTGLNLFCYNLTVNDKSISKIKMQNIMQRDLKGYFGYCVSVETRKMPYWRLTKIPGYEKLKTKGGKQNRTGDNLSFVKYQNIPTSHLINVLWSKRMGGAPFIDETNIPWNIDITIDAVMTDFEDFRRSLKKNCLDLVKGEKEMKVIVIRDSGISKT